MNTTTALTTIQQSTKPPLTQKELLRATAIAMAKAQDEERERCDKERERLRKLVVREILKVSKGVKDSCKEINFGKAYRNGAYLNSMLEIHIKFVLDLGNPALADAFKAYCDFKVPAYRTEASFYEELRKKLAPGSRVNDVIANEQSRKLLAEAGKKILGMTTPDEAASAIDA